MVELESIVAQCSLEVALSGRLHPQLIFGILIEPQGSAAIPGVRLEEQLIGAQASQVGRHRGMLQREKVIGRGPIGPMFRGRVRNPSLGRPGCSLRPGDPSAFAARRLLEQFVHS